MRRFFLALIALTLMSCDAVPRLAEEDPRVFRFEETPAPTYDLALQAERPVETADVRVTGLELVIRSSFCVVESCVPDQNGFVRLLFPDEPDANYGLELVIDVLGGVPIRGTAHVILEGETLTRPATLRVQP